MCPLGAIPLGLVSTIDGAMLALLFFLILTNFPRLIMVGWSSLLYQISVFSLAWSDGTFLETATASQMLLIALSMLTALYFLSSISWKVSRALGNWSRPTLARRIGGSLVTAGAVSLIAMLWVPQVSFVGRSIPDGTQHFEVRNSETAQLRAHHRWAFAGAAFLGPRGETMGGSAEKSAFPGELGLRI